MKSIRYDGYCGPWMSRSMQKKRVANVIANELTAHQKRVVLGYYYEHKTITQLAQEFGVNKSTVWRTLRRAEDRMRRMLKYRKSRPAGRLFHAIYTSCCSLMISLNCSPSFSAALRQSSMRSKKISK